MCATISALPSPTISVMSSSSSLNGGQWSPGSATSSKENFDPASEGLKQAQSDDAFGKFFSFVLSRIAIGCNHLYFTDSASLASIDGSKKLTVIARHRRLGEESLSKLKDEVRKYAVDHTFKETAKKFGIHHSTVSGWVKAREKANSLGNLGGRQHGKISKWREKFFSIICIT